jgi:DNA-binding NtrC family response regulator
MKETMRIMVVDDEMIIRESFLNWFAKCGFCVDAASSGLEALDKLEKKSFDLLFIDIKMPGMDGIELLDRVKADFPDTEVVIITAYGSIDTAVKAMKRGAVDYLLKPFNPDQLTLVLEKVTQQKMRTLHYRYLKSHLKQMTRFDNIIGQSPPMKKIFQLILEVSKTDASILLTGETGTGKELVARAIHAKSDRAQHPFIALNCGAIPDSLLEAELFGHQKGAYTGATQRRKGYFEVVSGGTLFLDEIGEISQKMQVDLLRVLEEKKIKQLGGAQMVDVNFRLICATRQDLKDKIGRNEFREDLFYRLNVITIGMPPLRERKSDIPLLVDHFIDKYNEETSKTVDHVASDALHRIMAYDWPGNVRELRNAIERAVVLSKSRVLNIEDFNFLQISSEPSPDSQSLMEMEKQHIRHILDQYKGNVSQAARVLDINRATLHKKIKRYGLSKHSETV